MTARNSWQRCDSCGHEIDELNPAPRCPRCGGLLAVVHATTATREQLAANRSPSGVWRFGELVLPTAACTSPSSYPEGNTPLLSRAALIGWCYVEELRFKHVGLNPTGSF